MVAAKSSTTSPSATSAWPSSARSPCTATCCSAGSAVAKSGAGPGSSRMDSAVFTFGAAMSYSLIDETPRNEAFVVAGVDHVPPHGMPLCPHHADPRQLGLVGQLHGAGKASAGGLQTLGFLVAPLVHHHQQDGPGGSWRSRGGHGGLPTQARRECHPA